MKPRQVVSDMNIRGPSVVASARADFHQRFRPNARRVAREQTRRTLGAKGWRVVVQRGRGSRCTVPNGACVVRGRKGTSRSADSVPPCRSWKAPNDDHPQGVHVGRVDCRRRRRHTHDETASPFWRPSWAFASGSPTCSTSRLGRRRRGTEHLSRCSPNGVRRRGQLGRLRPPARDVCMEWFEVS